MLSAARIARPTAISRNVAAVSRRYASAGPSYHQPSGRVFGEAPLPKGQKRKWESWEAITYFGFFGGIVLGGVLQAYKPDTSITTWALQEAKERMEARGEYPRYVPSNKS